MNYRWIGAALVIAGCGGFGVSIAAGYRKQETMLRQLIYVLQFMESELKFRLTPLPELCRQASRESSGILREILGSCAKELERQTMPDVCSCMTVALREQGELPVRFRKHMRHLGNSLGRFDLPGQLRGLRAIQAACQEDLRSLKKDKDVRLRSYQTLSLCAGVALVILFL